MALNDTIKRIKTNVANIGSVMMIGKTIEERYSSYMFQVLFEIDTNKTKIKRKRR